MFSMKQPTDLETPKKDLEKFTREGDDMNECGNLIEAVEAYSKAIDADRLCHLGAGDPSLFASRATVFVKLAYFNKDAKSAVPKTMIPLAFVYLTLAYHDFVQVVRLEKAALDEKCKIAKDMLEMSLLYAPDIVHVYLSVGDESAAESFLDIIRDNVPNCDDIPHFEDANNLYNEYQSHLIEWNKTIQSWSPRPERKCTLKFQDVTMALEKIREAESLTGNVRSFSLVHMKCVLFDMVCTSQPIQAFTTNRSRIISWISYMKRILRDYDHGFKFFAELSVNPRKDLGMPKSTTLICTSNEMHKFYSQVSVYVAHVEFILARISYHLLDFSLVSKFKLTDKLVFAPEQNSDTLSAEHRVLKPYFDRLQLNSAKCMEWNSKIIQAKTSLDYPLAATTCDNAIKWMSGFNHNAEAPFDDVDANPVWLFTKFVQKAEFLFQLGEYENVKADCQFAWELMKFDKTKDCLDNNSDLDLLKPLKLMANAFLKQGLPSKAVDIYRQILDRAEHRKAMFEKEFQDLNDQFIVFVKENEERISKNRLAVSKINQERVKLFEELDIEYQDNYSEPNYYSLLHLPMTEDITCSQVESAFEEENRKLDKFDVSLYSILKHDHFMLAKARDCLAVDKTRQEYFHDREYLAAVLSQKSRQIEKVEDKEPKTGMFSMIPTSIVNFLTRSLKRKNEAETEPFKKQKVVV